MRLCFVDTCEVRSLCVRVYSYPHFTSVNEVFGNEDPNIEVDSKLLADTYVSGIAHTTVDY